MNGTTGYVTVYVTSGL